MRWKTTLASAVASAVVIGTPAAAQTIELTGTVRDFQESHSDFENHANWSFPLIQGMVMPDLGEDEKPVLAYSGGAPSDPVLTLGSTSHGNFEATVTFLADGVSVVSSEEITWVKFYFTDGSNYKFDNVDATSATLDTPESHAGKTLDRVKVRAYPDGVKKTLTFYEEDASVGQGGEPIPEVWRIASPESFNQWYRNVDGVNLATKHTIVLEPRPDNPNIYRFEASKHNGQSFFPIDGELYGNEGNSHNYHFTYEIKTKFAYTDPAERNYDMTFSFSGDDDVWVYVNGKLVIDIGGVHGEKHDSVNLDTIASQIGLEAGKNYDLHFFFAERHLVESNFTIETSIQFLSPLYD